MKYRTNQYVPENVGTEFSRFTTQYKLNEVTGLLEEAGQVDDQELIQSQEDCALNKVLERFGYVPEEYLNQRLPQKWHEEDDMFPNDTANMAAAADVLAEGVRQDLGLDPQQYSAKMVLQKALQIIEQEETKNAQTDNRQSQQTIVSQHSNEDTSSQSESPIV